MRKLTRPYMATVCVNFKRTLNGHTITGYGSHGRIILKRNKLPSTSPGSRTTFLSVPCTYESSTYTPFFPYKLAMEALLTRQDDFF